MCGTSSAGSGGSIPELRASPQNPHSPGPPGRLPAGTHGQDGIPRHTAARLLPWPYLSLIGLYAGSAGLARLTAPVLRAVAGLLVSGRSAVRIGSPAPVSPDVHPGPVPSACRRQARETGKEDRQGRLARETGKAAGLAAAGR